MCLFFDNRFFSSVGITSILITNIGNNGYSVARVFRVNVCNTKIGIAGGTHNGFTSTFTWKHKIIWIFGYWIQVWCKIFTKFSGRFSTRRARCPHGYRVWPWRAFCNWSCNKAFSIRVICFWTFYLRWNHIAVIHRNADSGKNSNDGYYNKKLD